MNCHLGILESRKGIGTSIQLRLFEPQAYAPHAELVVRLSVFLKEDTIMVPLGQVAITPNALNVLSKDAVYPARHQAGDWGEVCDEDRGLNGEALKDGSRFLSVYRDGVTKFWIITDVDRSATTVLLPEDY